MLVVLGSELLNKRWCNVMKTEKNRFIKKLRYLCLVGVIALGFMTIIGTTDNKNEGDGETSSNTSPTVTVTSPSNDSAYTQGDTITFIGIGNDIEDGNLTGNSLVWTSDIDGQIGTGEFFTMDDLSLGIHTITLTTTDSDGATGIDSITITVRSWVIPDTGQTQSYTETFGEDSDYTINPPSYTDNGDGTVSDNVTGLIWQQEDDDTRRIWEEACSYCDDLTLAGYSDWRLPSKKELMSIVNYGTGIFLSIDITYFSNTHGSFYWSSTTYVDNSSYAWDVNFSNGSVIHHSKSGNSYVRCVRGGTIDAGDFTDNGDGTVTDNNTGLTWQQDEGGAKTWEDAIVYCEALSLAGYTDWRLPNIKELESITDDNLYDPAIDTNYFPDAHANYYWSSTTGIDIRYPEDSFYAWRIHFSSGSVSYYYKSLSHYVRCVRGGQ